MRILLTGKLGQLGSTLCGPLDSLGELTAIDRIDLDLGDSARLDELLDDTRPELIVNAAAYTDVDEAETDREAAFRLNEKAPEQLAKWARRRDASIIHYSTDYVFDSRGTKPRDENAECMPLSVYGESKLAGDMAVLESGAACLVARTSWLYSANGKNFVRTMLRLGADRDRLSVVDDQIGAPTSANVLADTTLQILAQSVGDISAMLREKGGLINVTASGETSWHGFAHEIFSLARRHGADLSVEVVDGIPSSDYPTPARRPLNSRLSLKRLRERFGITPPDWRTALGEVIDEIYSLRK